MEIVSIIFDVIIIISCAVLCYLSLKMGKENMELRKDLSMVLRNIPGTNTAEYICLVKKYHVKDLNFKE